MRSARPARPARSIAALVAATATVVALAGCTGGAPMPTPSITPSPTLTPSGDGTLTIGALVPTTGALSFLGASEMAGINVAIAEINAAGGVNGVPVKLVQRDSGDGGATADTAFADLVANHVDVVVGPSTSSLAIRLLPAAATAKVPLISPAATYPQARAADVGGWLFRTVGTMTNQGAALGTYLGTHGGSSVAVIGGTDEASKTLVAAFEPALAAAGGKVGLSLSSGADAAGLVKQVAAANPSAVVLALPDNGDATLALLKALADAKLTGAKLWLTSGDLADYSQALPAGMLDQTNGILEGAAPSDAFAARLKAQDGNLADTRLAAESYDATILAALAAAQAHDDGGPSIRATLVAASAGGLKCTSFAECATALRTASDIDYDGVSGPLNLGVNGDPVTAGFGLYRYDGANRLSRVGSVTG